jgi:hypothetical protein
MFRAFYDKLQPCLGDDLEVGMSDTDSFILRARGSSPEQLLSRLGGPFMDFSNYHRKSPLHSDDVKGRPGTYKDELEGVFRISRAVFLRSKSYSLECVESPFYRAMLEENVAETADAVAAIGPTSTPAPAKRQKLDSDSDSVDSEGRTARPMGMGEGVGDGGVGDVNNGADADADADLRLREHEHELAVRELESYRNAYDADAAAAPRSVNRNKGLKRRVVERASFDMYWDTLHNTKSHQATQVVIRSKKHALATVRERRAFTSPFDDKRHIYGCLTHSDPHFSSRIRTNEGRCYAKGCHTIVV